MPTEAFFSWGKNSIISANKFYFVRLRGSIQELEKWNKNLRLKMSALFQMEHLYRQCQFIFSSLELLVSKFWIFFKLQNLRISKRNAPCSFTSCCWHPLCLYPVCCRPAQQGLQTRIQLPSDQDSGPGVPAPSLLDFGRVIQVLSSQFWLEAKSP